MQDNKAEKIALFKQAREAFLDPTAKHATLLLPQVKVFKQGKFIVFGVKKEEQAYVNYDELRVLLAKEMGFKSDTPFVQVIGNSTLYSSAGTVYVAKYLDEELSNAKSIILYGYTGSKNTEPNLLRRDVNQLLSDWADHESDAHERSRRVIANIVDEHTLTAINEWGSTISENVNHFYLVYSDTPNPSVKFGDDIQSSDSITNSSVLAFEGGIQTLRQIIYMLCRGVLVKGFVNLRDLRDPNDSINFDPVTRQPYLSAVHFLNHMKTQLEKVVDEAEPVRLKETADKYLDGYARYNKIKPDASTKQALWDDAWKHFVEEGRKHLALFSCQFCHVSEYSDNKAIRAMIERREQVEDRANSMKAVKSHQINLSL